METVVTVKFRDIEYEEAIACTAPPLKGTEEQRRNWWNKHRNKIINILTPGREPSPDKFLCHGPIFRVLNSTNYSGYPYNVCPHIAEIGD